MTTAGALASHVPVRHRGWLQRSANVSEVGIPVSGLIFVVGVLLVYGNFLRIAFDMFGTVFPADVRGLSIVVGPAVMGIAAAAAVVEGVPAKVGPAYRTWLTLLAFVLLCLFVTGAVVFENDVRVIVLDTLLFPTVFAGIFVGARWQNWAAIDRIMLAIFVVNIAVCVVGLPDVVAAAARATRVDRLDFIRTGASAIWGSPNVYFFWGGLGVWPYFVLTAPGRSRAGKWASYFGMALFFLLAVIYQKRMPFVELAGFVVLTGLKSYPGRLKLLSVLAPVALVVWALTGAAVNETGDLRSRLGSRFDKTGAGLWATLQEEDRLTYDPVLVLTQFNATELIVGRGLGGTVHDVTSLYPEEFTHTLHNGTALMALKGGLVLVVVWFAGWLGVFADFLRSKDVRLLPYYVPVLMVFGLAWLSGFGFGSVNCVLVMLCAGRVMSRPLADRAPRCRALPLHAASRQTAP